MQKILSFYLQSVLVAHCCLQYGVDISPYLPRKKKEAIFHMSLVIMDAVIPATPEMYLYRTASFSTSSLTMLCLAPHSWTGAPGGNQSFSSVFFSDRKGGFRRRPWFSASLEHLLDFRHVHTPLLIQQPLKARPTLRLVLKLHGSMDSSTFQRFVK